MVASSNPQSSAGIDAAARSALEEDSKFQESTVSFPEKIMNLLERGELSECMWWLSGTISFCIRQEGFAEKVLDLHFQGTKFESFTRKLNRW
jgi:HSF-type DNA-binding